MATSKPSSVYKNNIQKDRVALIIGNGPSVDHLDPNLFQHFTTFGCNHIQKKFEEWGRAIDHIVITDSNRIQEIGSAYKDFQGELFIGDERYVDPPVRAIRQIVGRNFTPLRQLKKESLEKFSFINHWKCPKLLYTSLFHKLKFSFDFEKGLNFGYSVVTSAIQIAAIRGHKTILLTGVDSSYQKDKDYFKGADKDIHYVNQNFISNPRLYMEPILALAQVYLDEMGVQLIDCTPGGKLKFITKGEFLSEAPYYRVTRGL